MNIALRYDRKLMYISCEGKANKVKGKILFLELFGLKLLAKINRTLTFTHRASCI